jgi:hypothetical protein
VRELKGAGYVGSEQLGLNVFTFGETFFSSPFDR